MEKFKCKNEDCGLEEGQIPGITFHWKVDWYGHICSICDDRSNKFIDRIVDRVIKKRLIRLGAKTGFCKKCNEEIIYIKTKNRKIMPTCLNLISHFSNCPNAEDFRKQ